MNEINHVKPRATLTLITLITSLGFLDTHLLMPVMALYASELGANVGIVGIVIGLYSITNTPANIYFGRLIDRIGYKLPLVLGLIGDMLSMFLYSICRSPLQLALVRAFHGTAGGIVGPSTMSVIAEQSSKTDKAQKMSIYGMALASASLIGYPLSGLIVSRLGFRVLFLFGSALMLIATIASFFLPGSRRSNDIPKSTPLKDMVGIKCLLKRNGLLIGYCAVFAQYFTFGGVVTLLPIYAKSIGMEALHVGMSLGAFAITFIIVQFPSGIISDRFGRIKPTTIGLFTGAVSLVLLPSIETFALLAAVMALYGIAYGALFPSISALVADHTSTEERGIAMGIFHALLTAGVAIGAPVIGWVAEFTGVETGMMSIAGIMVLALIATLILSKRS